MHKVNVDVGIRVRNDGTETTHLLGSEVEIPAGAQIELNVGRHYPPKALEGVPVKSVVEAVNAGWIIQDASTASVHRPPQPPEPFTKE